MTSETNRPSVPTSIATSAGVRRDPVIRRNARDEEQQVEQRVGEGGRLGQPVGSAFGPVGRSQQEPAQQRHAGRDHDGVEQPAPVAPWPTGPSRNSPARSSGYMAK